MLGRHYPACHPREAIQSYSRIRDKKIYHANIFTCLLEGISQAKTRWGVRDLSSPVLTSRAVSRRQNLGHCWVESPETFHCLVYVPWLWCVWFAVRRVSSSPGCGDFTSDRLVTEEFSTFCWELWLLSLSPLVATFRPRRLHGAVRGTRSQCHVHQHASISALRCFLKQLDGVL